MLGMSERIIDSPACEIGPHGRHDLFRQSLILPVEGAQHRLETEGKLLPRRQIEKPIDDRQHVVPVLWQATIDIEEV
jgi:hypothetical protein